MEIHYAKEYNVNPRDLQLIMRPAVIIVGEVFGVHKKEFMITCTGGGDHSLTNLHSWGFAFDVRTRNLSAPLKTKMFNEIQARFKGTGYQIIFHATHFHVEYDPGDWKQVFNLL